MITSDEKKLIEDIILEFFNKAGYSVFIKSFECLNNGKEILSIDLGTEEAQILIGKQGSVLADIQLLLRKIINKELKKEIYLNLDIDNYKKNKEEYLRDLAESVADEVVITRQSKEIALSSSFDRRIIHLELTKREDVIAESRGEGEHRKIVIKPK